nr:type II toxin-antitoxin system RelE/ParE family toxin [Pseudomonas aeruginosa]
MRLPRGSWFVRLAPDRLQDSVRSVRCREAVSLSRIPLMEYSLGLIFCGVGYRVYTDEFGDWWGSLSEDEQESLAVTVRLLEERGPSLGHPHSSGINGSRHGHMRELRTQHGGRPFRTLYAFDPRRSAILLIGGDKTGDDRWYELNVPIADRLYDEHLHQLREEGLIDG